MFGDAFARLRRHGRLIGMLGAPSVEAAGSSAPTVIAIVGEDGLEVLHSEFRTSDGRDAQLPAQVARTAVRVPLPPASLDYEDRVELLKQGPLGAAQAPHPVLRARHPAAAVDR